MKLQSIKFLLLCYIGIAMFAAMLLTLPFCNTIDLDFFDAFFTAISALTCTGLIIKDTALDFTHIGHGIILFLIQLGGFGYMSLLGLIYILLRKRLSNAEKNMLKEALNHNSYDNLMDFIKKILVYVLVIESIGALLLSIDFSVRFGLKEGIWYGVFHSVAAFNNSGFSIFATSLTDFRDDLLVNFTICALIFLGGIGYVCLAELHLYAREKIKSPNHKHHFSLHLKVVFSANIFLFILGAAIVLILEWNNENTFKGFDFIEKIIAALFTSANYRSAGFVSYDVSMLNISTLFFSTIFMLIGSAPGGTTAGIKVTTLAVLFAFYRSILNNSEPNLFKRTITSEQVQKSFFIFTISSFYFLIVSLLLAITEPNVPFFELAFEAASAFTNVGISTGDGGILSLSKNFNDIGKILIIISMVLGKIGVVIFTLALFGRTKVSRVSYAKEKILL